jgi:fumarylacetoacetate (FAA) hydrolase
MLLNDVSLRNLIPTELSKGFGFFQSKPATAFSPVAVTPDELGDAWDGAKVHLPVAVYINGAPFGEPDAGADMTFHFPQLIAPAAKTRALTAGTIVGSGHLQRRPQSRHYMYRRETHAPGAAAKTRHTFPSLRDRAHRDAQHDGNSIFGAIDQEAAVHSAD